MQYPTHPSHSKLFFLLLFLLTAAACKKETATMDPQTASSYIYAYTSGLVSKEQDIRVQFAQPVIAEDQVGQPAAAGVLEFDPAVKGTATWLDRQTLRFVPADGFTPGATYEVVVHLDEVYQDLPKGPTAFAFTLQVREQFFEVDVDGLYYPDVRQLAKQAIQGTVYTADVATAEQLNELLTATQGNQRLAVSWTPGADGLVHQYEVQGVARGNEASEVELVWNGEAIGVDREVERTVEVPAIGDFKVLEAEQERGADTYLSIRFSDPLDPAQDLSGLIRIAGLEEEPRFIVEGNLVRAYTQNVPPGRRQVSVLPGIKNIEGKPLPRPSEWSVEFSSSEPQVRLVGNGVILPEGQGLYFPFEAIGLRAVEVEVFKIFNNNILQFLQTNNLDGTYDMQRVGRIIVRETIELTTLTAQADFSQWTRYGLDLNQLIQRDREAIYQVRIGFRPSQAVFACGDVPVPQASARSARTVRTVGFVPEESFMDKWYGIDGDPEQYDWENRDNPCNAAYYNPNRFIQRNVIASNLGLLAKRAADRRTMVVVTDLRNASPVSGARVRFYDFQQQQLTEASTNGDGVVEVETEFEPFIIVAEAGSERGYLRLQDGESLPMARFDVSGVSPTYGLKGFLYGDRGVWRPGDSVYLNFILEDRENHLPADYPVNFELRDARGQVRIRRTVAPKAGSMYALHFATTADDATGGWLARVEAGGATFEKRLRIETVKPNRLKIDLDFGGQALRSTGDGTARAEISASWLTGAPADGLRAVVEGTFRVDESGFQRYANFAFTDPARKQDASEPMVLFEGTLSGEGTAGFNVQLPEGQQAPGKMQAAFRTRVFESGGDFSIDNQTVPFYPYQAYAGIQIPADQYGEKRIDQEKGGSIRVVAVDEQGRPLANRQLTVGLYRVEWRWWWDDGYDNVSQYNSSTHLNSMSQQEVTTNARGEAAYQARVDDWGRYLVRVCDTESGHCSGDYFYAGYPSDEGMSQERAQAAVLLFKSDKEKYNVGDNVQLTLPAGEAGRALISLENGAGVVQTHWIQTKAGDNSFSFKTTAEMSPTVYANVTLLQPYGQTQNDRPIRMFGVVPITVENPGSRLQPTIATAAEWKPETTVDVEVGEAQGRAMNYTLAVVDEGLLGLTRFATPNPHESFYAREALGVRTWDIYDQVLGAFGGQLERVLAIGGDGDLVRNPDADRANRFEPVVRHLGPFTLAKGRKVRHKVQIPNYVGAVRVMVVAEQDRAYGAADKSVPVRKPLMVLATLPRVVGPGETLKLPVNVFAMDQKVKNVRVQLQEKKGLASLTGNTTQQLTFARTGDQLVDFDVLVGDRTGVAEFEVVAEGGGERATQTIQIQVRNPNPVQTRTQTYTLEPGQTLDVPYEPFGTGTAREALLEVASIPAIRAGEQLRYLLQYPYGCLEQVVSGAFPQLYVDRLMELTNDQRERARRNITAAINGLPRFQHTNGGFTYWPGRGYEADAWVSSYVGHFLLEARARGYTLPPNTLDQWLRYQRAAARQWNPSISMFGYVNRQQLLLDQSYRLYTLALAQRADLGAMNQLREVPDLSIAARWRLAGAYVLAGKPEIATRLTQNTGTEVRQYQELGYTYGSDLRDQAMILETLVQMDDKQQTGELALRLARRVSEREWLSTQEASFALLAIGKYVGEAGAARRVTFQYTLNGRTVDAGSDQPLLQIALPANVQGQQTVRLKNTSNQRQFATVILTGQPVVGAEQPESQNLQMQVRYLDGAGRPVNVANLQQGTDFYAEVTVTNPGSLGADYKEMALRQIFPSGWEILNARLDNVGTAGEEGAFDYRDYRDDRVLTFFDLPNQQTQRYRVQLNAAYRGRYYLPAVSCEAMYDNAIRAATAGQWVEVL